jgi:hypothetical protein
MWNGRGHFIGLCLLSAVAKAMADKFELPPSSLNDSYAETGILTCCQTTSVFYQNLDTSKGKRATDYTDFTDLLVSP